MKYAGENMQDIKKKVLTVIISVVLILAAAFCVFRFAIVGGSRMRDGKYKITGNDQYPDACIVVKDGTIQFENIDLNSMFRESAMKVYRKRVEMGSVAALSESELNVRSDLNETFVNNPYEVTCKPVKWGTFTYRYQCIDEMYFFGFIIDYDSFHKSITVYGVGNGESGQLVFKK